MKQNSLRAEMEKILDQLKKNGWTRGAIEKRLNYSENYIDQQLSRGNNKRFLKALIDLNEQILQNTTSTQQTGDKVDELITVSKEPLEKAIMQLTEATNRHSIIDERNSRNIERLITLLEQRFEREHKGPGLAPPGTPGTVTRNPRKEKKSA